MCRKSYKLTQDKKNEDTYGKRKLYSLIFLL